MEINNQTIRFSPESNVKNSSERGISVFSGTSKLSKN